MLGMVAAGAPIEPITQAELVAVLPPLLRGGETFALRVKGESMKDDGIFPGDLVVVRKQEGNPETKLIERVHNIDMLPSGTYTSIAMTP